MSEPLARLYLEPTNQCNLACATCMRRGWEEPAGWMEAGVFDAALRGLEEAAARQGSVPLVFLGGYGEPLAHPRILEMIAALKRLGGPVELITNGTLLTQAVSAALVELGLDRLWVSIDGADPASYADVRLGDCLPEVTGNLEALQALRAASPSGKPDLGIAFVLLRRNQADLPAVIRLGTRLGADRFSITHVLAHTSELKDERLYGSPADVRAPVSPVRPLLQLPRFSGAPDLPPGSYAYRVAGQDLTLGGCTCPFLEKGSASLRWDGALSPCLPLLHTHTSYLEDRLRRSEAFSVGSILERSLLDLWADPGYVGLRARLRSWDFSPCVFCNTCEMADSNREDCFGNVHPTCGGCLWAQGIIQCP